MTELFLVGDELTVTGLRMAGLKDAHVSDPQNVASLLEQAGEDKIIVITHSLFNAARKKLEKMKENIVIEIPDSAGGGEDVVNSVIKDVIGFEVTKG